MKAINLTLSSLLGLVMSTGVYAQGPTIDCDDLDLNSITYIEDENEFDLGFNTEDYLPLDFNPYQVYVDLDAIQFIEEENVVIDLGEYLPHDFDAFAYPMDFRTIDYVDPTDEVCLDFDSKENLPDGFDPYSRTKDSNIVSL